MSNVCYEAGPERINIVLSGRVDIRSVAELQRALTEAVGNSQPVIVDCMAAEWLDTAAMQLLLAAHRTAPGRLTVRVSPESAAGHWLEQSGFARELTLA